MGGRQRRERREKCGVKERINRDTHKRDGGGGRNGNKRARGEGGGEDGRCGRATAAEEKHSKKT